MTTREATDSYRFQAEIRQLLQILVHSLYQDREIFLRELISNASDALTQIHFQMLTDRSVHDAEAELAIHLEVEERDGKKWLIVRDSGIGMSREEMIQNLGTIAQSGARSFLERLKDSDASPGDIIGQFGVGFYSVFMVAEEVHVVSRSYRPDAEAAVWISSGDDSFRVESAEKSSRGTEIHIRLKEDAQEFASEWRLREIVKRHSDFVSYPIYLDGEQINQQQPLWRKSPSEATEEEYHNFYQQMTMDFQEPLATVHFHSDAPVHVRALLFVPASRDRGILAARKEPGIMLYSHNILIQEYNTDLLPKWLEFVDGVVDSEDLPLNVSRETVQSNRFMRGLGKTLRRRMTRTLEEMAADDPEKYNRFWNQQSRTIKEGLVTDPSALKDVLPLLRFYSSKSEDTLISLDDYIGRMPPEQDSIYFVLGDSVAAVAQSPHLDPFQARGIEVLYWVDPLDAFVAPLLKEYKDKPFKNIDDAGLELPEIEGAEDGETEELPLSEPQLNRLIGRFVTVLGDRVVEVRASKLLKRSAVRLVSPEGTAGREMERIYRLMGQEYEVPKRILEINPRHPLIVSLARLVSSRSDAAVNDLTVEQLYAGALLQEGLHPDPAEMLPRIEKLMEIATQSELGEAPVAAGDENEEEE